MTVTDTTLEAFFTCQEKLNAKEAEVLEGVKAFGPATSRMIEDKSDIERSTITGRLNALVKKEYIYIAFKDKCKINKKRTCQYYQVMPLRGETPLTPTTTAAIMDNERRT